MANEVLAAKQMEEIKFLVQNGLNEIIPQKSLHVKEYRFESFVITNRQSHAKQNREIISVDGYIFIHCNYLHNKNCISKQVNEDLNVIEYLPLFGKNTIGWKRSLNDYTPVDCVIEGPIDLYLSKDGKTKSDQSFQAVLSLRCS